jgi:hypothetical protein
MPAWGIGTFHIIRATEVIATILFKGILNYPHGKSAEKAIRRAFEFYHGLRSTADWFGVEYIYSPIAKG